MFRITTNGINANSNASTINPINRHFVAALSFVLLALALAAPTITFAQGDRSTGRTRDDQRRTQPTNDGNTVLVNPLPESDPRAKLDPDLLNVEPMTPPVYAATAEQLGPDADDTVGYDLRTGEETRTKSAASNFVESFAAKTKGTLSGSTGANLNQDFSDLRDDASVESVIGADNRVKITNTAVYPWRAMTKLYITFPNGITTSCSGALINTKYVLTAGHCVYNASRGGFARTVRVVPGANGSYAPYGSVYATYVRAFSGWISSSSADHDAGLVTLASPIGASTGWLGLKAYGTVDGLVSNIAGYPGDKADGGLYYHWGPVTHSTSLRSFYQIDTAPGQSGSGVYHIESSGNRYVHTVHAYGAGSGSYNSGTRINSSKFSTIISWMSSGF
jgi:glutamyl endopeptidase